MTALVPNAFIGNKEHPTDAELAQALGPAKTAWETLVAELACELNVAVQEWKCYSPKAGWSLRLKRGSRTIVWLTPCRGCFRVAFALGEKAVSAAREADLPARVIRLIDEAEKYPEGTGVRLVVKGPKDVPVLKRLAAIKLAN